MLIPFAVTDEVLEVIYSHYTRGFATECNLGDADIFPASPSILAASPKIDNFPVYVRKQKVHAIEGFYESHTSDCNSPENNLCTAVTQCFEVTTSYLKTDTTLLG